MNSAEARHIIEHLQQQMSETGLPPIDVPERFDDSEFALAPDDLVRRAVERLRTQVALRSAATARTVIRDLNGATDFGGPIEALEVEPGANPDDGFDAGDVPRGDDRARWDMAHLPDQTETLRLIDDLLNEIADGGR